MSRIVIAQIPDDNTEVLLRNTGKNTRGARVYGPQMSPEVASFIEDVAPENARQRLMNMFFAGRFNPVGDEEDEQ